MRLNLLLNVKKFAQLLANFMHHLHLEDVGVRLWFTLFFLFCHRLGWNSDFGWDLDLGGWRRSSCDTRPKTFCPVEEA